VLEQGGERGAVHGHVPVGGVGLAAALVPDSCDLRAVVVTLDVGFLQPFAEFGAGLVLGFDDDAGDSGDVAAVLGGSGEAAFGVDEAEAAEVVDDGAFGGGAFVLVAAHQASWAGVGDGCGLMLGTG